VGSKFGWQQANRDIMERHNEPLPDNWSAGIGESSTNYYDMWYYQRDEQCEVHVWWDEGNPYRVSLLPIIDFNEHGDPVYDYEQQKGEFDTLKEAEEFAWSLMEEHA
jgi:hypothetical protein